MTKITNSSSSPRVVAGQLAEPGATVEVPAELAKALLEQPDVWAKPGKRRKTTNSNEEADR